jgi:hypothetical protein
MASYMLDRPPKGEGKHASFYQGIQIDRVPGAEEGCCTMSIYDTIDGALVKKKVQITKPEVAKDVSSPSNKSKAPRSLYTVNIEDAMVRPPNSVTRVIWYDYTEGLDMAMVKILGATYNIDPRFFGETVFGAHCKEYGNKYKRPLLLKQPFFLLEFPDAETRLAAIFFKEATDMNGFNMNAGKCWRSSESRLKLIFEVVIVLSRSQRPSYYDANMKLIKPGVVPYNWTLEAMTREDIIQAEADPFKFLHPYLEDWTARRGVDFHEIISDQTDSFRQQQAGAFIEQRYGVEPRNFILDRSIVTALNCQLWLQSLSNILKNIKRFEEGSEKPDDIVPNLKELVELVHTIRNWNREMLEWTRDDLNRDVSNLAIEESKKSIEQAISVKREQQLLQYLLELSLILPQDSPS